MCWFVYRIARAIHGLSNNKRVTVGLIYLIMLGSVPVYRNSNLIFKGPLVNHDYELTEFNEIYSCTIALC